MIGTVARDDAELQDADEDADSHQVANILVRQCWLSLENMGKS